MPVNTDRDILERVKGKLFEYLDDAAEGARLSGRAVSLAAYYVRQRERLNVVRLVLRGLAEPEDHERVFREAERAYFRRREMFDHASNSSALLRAWTDVLVEATEKVSNDRRDAQIYATVAGDATVDDREWSEASARVAGNNWRES
jgi:hypothetical protein